MRRPEDIQIDKYTLKEILDRHELWLSSDNQNNSELRANLKNINLSEVDLSYANLRDAILDNVNLSYACLNYSNLSGAEIKCSNFTHADLQCAQLYHTCIYNGTFYAALFDGAQLFQAFLYNTVLVCANFDNANLACAVLDHTNIDKASFTSCNLYRTKMYEATGSLLEYRTGKILTEPIIGYKKCKYNVIVTLEIPKDAIVFSINGTKCRTNKAKVIDIDGADRAFSIFNTMTYYIGDEFNIKDFNCEYNRECANGIHFFMTREEAENYTFF